MKKSVLGLLVVSFFLSGCVQGQEEVASSDTETISSTSITSATSASGSSSSSATPSSSSATPSSSSNESSSSVDTVYTLWPDQYTIPSSAPMTFGDYVVEFSGFSSTTIQPFDDEGNAKSAVSVFALAPNGWVGYGPYPHGTAEPNLPKCTSFNYTMLDVASDADDLPGLACVYGPSADKPRASGTNPTLVRAVKDLDATHRNIRVISGTVTFPEATSFFDLENVFLRHADGTHESTPTLDAYFLDLTVELAVS